jgi:hypothetical protein
VPLRASDDIDDNEAVVLATLGTSAVRDAQSATLALREPCALQPMMASPLGGLGAIPTHSYYHKYNTVNYFGPIRNRVQKVVR